MWISYLTIAIRTIKRNSLFTVLNILGLAIGMASSIILLLYVNYEFSYDKHIHHADRIFELCAKDKRTGELRAGFPGPLGPYLKLHYPEIESYARVSPPNWEKKIIVNVGENAYSESRSYLVDFAFFDIFDCQLISGNFARFSTDKNVVVLTENTAKKYFNSTDIIGETIILNEDIPFVVIAVIKDVPQNSHFRFDVLLPISWISEWYAYADIHAWRTSNLYYTYLKLKENATVKMLNDKLANDLSTIDEEIAKKLKYVHFEPITSIHLDNVKRDFKSRTAQNYLFIYLGIAIVILSIASINYLNLLTAIYLRRTREVGIRKVIGATRKKIKIQFLSESVLITLVALFLALILIESILPMLNQALDSSIYLSYLDIRFVGFCIGIVVLVGILSGVYPAFVISSVIPAQILKSGYISKKSNLILRNILVTFQFIISIILIIVSLVIYLQLNHVHSFDVGYNKKNLIMIPTYTEGLNESVDEFKNMLNSNPRVESMSACSFLPSNNTFFQSVCYEGEPHPYSKTMSHVSVDENFFKTFQIELIKGSNFDGKDKGMLHDYILSESAVKAFGWEDNPIGKELSIYSPELKGKVIGVVEDVNFKSLHHELAPCLFHADIPGYRYSYLVIRLDENSILAALEEVKRAWFKIYPKYPFEYFFAEEDLRKMYQSEYNAGKLIGFFSILSIAISCMGLFGLIAYSAQQQTKEISVRKVFGATTKQIFYLLCLGYTKSVVIASLIAWPISFFILDKWLQNFSYHINLSWWIFVISGLVTLLIALVTVSYHAVRTANTNPAKTLKFE